MPQQIGISVEGLAELRRALRTAEHLDDLTELRLGLKRAADVVAQDARSRVPVRSGRARDSIRAVSGGNKAYVVGGKSSVRYYGWLDFGTRSPISGRSRKIGPWSSPAPEGPDRGRFIYPAFDAKRYEVVELVSEACENALRRAGF